MKIRCRNHLPAWAFTLLEVIIACAIFFIAGFAILSLVTRSVAAARALQHREPDAGMLAAVLSLTNKLTEGVESGDFKDICGDLYADYSWEREITEIGSNGYFRVDFLLYNDKRKGSEPVKLTTHFYRPDSPPGRMTEGR